MRSLRGCLFVFSILLAFRLSAQSVSEAKDRFNKYLNLKGSLTNYVLFEEDVIFILNDKGQKEFAVYSDEIKLVGDFFENSSLDQQLRFYNEKGIKRFTQKQKDSLFIANDNDSKIPNNKTKKELAGIRIAIDPGHFSASIIDAKIEGKYVSFPKSGKDKDSVKLVEGQLTFFTAQLLKIFVEDQGATVLLTRPGQNKTAFNLSYDEWYKKRRVKVLDSLLELKEITPVEHAQFVKLPKDKFFWKFFRDYELLERARLMNAFRPHLSVIIHYNVDDRNYPWTKPSQKNFTMSFIPGAFVAGDLKKVQNRMHFTRLMLTNQVEKSKNLSALTINAFINNLKIPPAKENDANYLVSNTILVNDGVFARNLILTRYVNSPLVYGESLFQDNASEANYLSTYNFHIHGLSLPERIYTVAKSYYDAIITYFSNY